MPINTGITTNKNLLGCDVFILGYFFMWHALKTLREPRSRARTRELVLCGVFLFMVWWLFSCVESKTSLMSMLIAVSILIFAGFRWLDKRMIGFYLLLIGLGLIMAETFFGIYEVTLRLLGRSATLTDRTLLWADLLRADINPLFGAGFESFWLGPRLQHYWKRWTFMPNQAHNGYLETYLTLGLIGLGLLIVLLLATYAKAQRSLVTNFEWGRFRLGFLFGLIAFNWTEAAFKTTHFVFLLFYMIALDYPSVWRRTTRAAPRPGGEPAAGRMRKEALVGSGARL